MSAKALSCPRQKSIHIVKNGRIDNGRQNNKCKVCGKQFIQNPTKKVIGQDRRDLIDKLLLERLSLAEITRITGVSQWLQTYVNKKSKMTPPQIEDVARLSPLGHSHINMLGRYFSLPFAVMQGEMRSLRVPNNLNEQDD